MTIQCATAPAAIQLSMPEPTLVSQAYQRQACPVGAASGSRPGPMAPEERGGRQGLGPGAPGPPESSGFLRAGV